MEFTLPHCSFPCCNVEATTTLRLVGRCKGSITNNCKVDMTDRKTEEVDPSLAVVLTPLLTSTTTETNAVPQSEWTPIRVKPEWPVCGEHGHQLRLLLTKQQEFSTTGKEELAVLKKFSANSLTFNFLARSILLLSSLLVFYNSLHGDLCYDDHVALQNNEDVVGSGTSLWSNDYWGNSLQGVWTNKSYRPLTVITFRWNYIFVETFLAGKSGSGLSITWPFHATNILLHGFVTLCVYDLARLILIHFNIAGAIDNEGPPAAGTVSPKLSNTYALLAAMMFSVHPIHSEAVANITGRSELLSALFALLGLQIYGLPDSSRSSLLELCRTLSACALVCMAGLSKESGLTMFAVFLLRDWLHLFCRFNSAIGMFRAIWYNCRLRWIFTTMSATVAIGWRMLLTSGTSLDMHPTFNKIAFLEKFWHRVMSYAYCQVVAGSLLLWPAGLSYNHNDIESITAILDLRNLNTLCAWTFIGAIGLLSIRCRKDRPAALFSWGLGVISFLPASQVFFPVGFLVAERTMYLPSVGFVLLVVVLMRSIARPNRSTSTESNRLKIRQVMVSLFIAGLICLSLGVRTIVRNTAWSTDLDLRWAALSVYPNSRSAHHGIGYYYITKGKDQPNATELAEHFLTRAYKIDPTFGIVGAQLARIHFEKNNMTRAISLFEEAAQHRSEYATNVGCLLVGVEGRFQEAETHFMRALKNKLHPWETSLAYVLNNVGVMHTHRSFSKQLYDPDKAVIYFKEAYKIMNKAKTIPLMEKVTTLRNLAIATAADEEKKSFQVRHYAEQVRELYREADEPNDNKQREFEKEIFVYLSAAETLNTDIRIQATERLSKTHLGVLMVF